MTSRRRFKKVFFTPAREPYRWEPVDDTGTVLKRVFGLNDKTDGFYTWSKKDLTNGSYPTGLEEALEFYGRKRIPKGEGQKVAPFVNGYGVEWLPAGDGCVRVLSNSVIYHRARRHADGLEWQRHDSKEWVLNPRATSGHMWDGIAKDALDHFWPLEKAPTKSFKDRLGEVWRREGDELRSNARGRMWRTADGQVRVTWQQGKSLGLQCNSSWSKTVIKALAPEWLDLSTDSAIRAAAAPAENSPVFELGATVEDVSAGTGLVCTIVSDKDSQGRYWVEYLGYEGRKILVSAKHLRPYQASNEIEWTFVAVPEKVDIARCLREAYEAGAREVTIENDGRVTTYYHQEVWGILADSGAIPWARAIGCSHPDWAPIDEEFAGRLVQARAWEAAQKEKARRVRVTVRGVR